MVPTFHDKPGLKRRNLRATTDTELMAIAAPGSKVNFIL